MTEIPMDTSDKKYVEDRIDQFFCDLFNHMDAKYQLDTYGITEKDRKILASSKEKLTRVFLNYPIRNAS